MNFSKKIFFTSLFIFGISFGIHYLYEYKESIQQSELVHELPNSTYEDVISKVIAPKVNKQKYVKKIINKNTGVFLNNVQLVGLNNDYYSKNPNKLVFKNEISEDWLQRTEENLLRFHDQDTKVKVTKEKSIILLKRDNAFHANQVVITYLKKNGRKTSFKAYVNAQTGAVLQTWDKSISESYKSFN